MDFASTSHAAARAIRSYTYDQDILVEEPNASGTAVARYSQGLNIDEPLAKLGSATTSFYNADGLGTITSLRNTAGTLALVGPFFGLLVGAAVLPYGSSRQDAVAALIGAGARALLGLLAGALQLNRFRRRSQTLHPGSVA